jgi:hypothetical protein
MADIATLGIEVKTTGVEEATAELNKLSGAAARAEAAVDGFEAASQGATGAASSAAAGYTKQGAAVSVSSKQLDLMAKAADRCTDSFMTTATGVSNLQNKLKEMAVSAAASLNPLQTALDKGLDLAIMLGPMGATGRVSALGGVLRALGHPITLAIMGFIALGVAAIQYFTGSLVSGQKSAEMLAKQAGMVNQVADKWGAAVPALREYVDQLKRAQDISDFKQVASDFTSAQQEKIDKLFSDFTNDYPGEFNQAGVWATHVESEVHELGVALVSLQDKVSQGTVKVKDFLAVQAAATSAAAKTGRKDLEEFAGAFALLANSIIRPITALEEFKQQVAGALNTAAKTQEQLQFVDKNGSIRRPSEFMPQTDTPIPLPRPPIELEGMDWVSAPASVRMSAYGSASGSVQERINALASEVEAQKKLNPLVEDYGYSLTKAKTAAELLAAAEQDKKKITPELTADIDKHAEALAQATVEQNKLNEATTKAKAALDFAKGAATGFLSTLRQGLVSGEGWFKSLGNAALSVLDKIASKIEETFVNALFSTNGGGFNLFSFLTGGAAAAAGGGSVGGGAAASAKAAASVARPATLRNAAPPARTVAQGQGVHVTIGLKKDGLNIVPEVVGVARTEAGRAAGAIKAGFETWRRNEQHRDIEKHIANRRVIGR